VENQDGQVAHGTILTIDEPHRLSAGIARRYLAAIPPAVAGQHGDVHT
jgi:hypothetical protein